MQHRVIYNKNVLSGACSLLMFFTTAVLADSYSYQPIPQYSQQLADSSQPKRRQTNPWLLPQRQQNRPGYQQFPDHQDQHQYNQERYYSQEQQQDQQQDQRQSYNQERYYSQEQQQDQQQPYNQERYYSQKQQQDQEHLYQDFGFVTPETLESLKQQQTQTQLMPGSEQHQRFMQQTYGQRQYAYPSYGTGYSDPLYNTPAVSPWGGTPDILYRGNSFPWVPDAAIGGLPPIHVPPLGDPAGTERQEYNVFNPFSLVPYGN